MPANPLTYALKRWENGTYAAWEYPEKVQEKA
jgi:hypothetical protein